MTSIVFSLKTEVSLEADCQVFQHFVVFPLWPALRGLVIRVLALFCPLGTSFAHKTGERSLFGLIMTNKIKLAAITAGLILAGGLLSPAVGASAPMGQEPNTASQQIQKNTSGTQPSYEQFSVSGGREFFYKMLLSILAVAGLGAGVVYVSKKLLPKMSNLPGKQIRVIETHHLGPRKSIHLIRPAHGVC